MIEAYELNNRPTHFLGMLVKVFLKDRANDKSAFHFKITGHGPGYFEGYDDEQLNLRIEIEDIEFFKK